MYIRSCVVMMIVCILGFAQEAYAQPRHAHGIDHWFTSARDALPQTDTQYGMLIETARKENGIPKGIIDGMIFVESSGNARVPGGLLQVSKGAEKVTKSHCNVTKPECGIPVAAKYLSYLHITYNLPWPLTVTAYNRGTGAVQHNHRICSDTYCKKVFKIAELVDMSSQDN